MKPPAPLPRPVACRPRPYLAVLSLGALAGCASVVVEPQAIDEFLPRQVAGGVSCRQPNALEANGSACQFIVQPGIRPDRPGNRTGIRVEPGERYRITLPGKQFWYDLERRVPAPEGDDGAGITKFMGFTKHHTELKWFALMARVTPPGAESAGNPLAKPVSAGDGVFCFETAGELGFYVNDADGFYDNNSGRVLVEIQRLAAPAERRSRTVEPPCAGTDPGADAP